MPSSISTYSLQTYIGFALQRTYISKDRLRDETKRDTWGAIQSKLAFDYDALFRLKKIDVTDTTNTSSNLVRYGYDKDNFLIQAGNLEIVRDAQTAAPKTKILNNITTNYTYDSTYGELSKISYSYRGKDIHVIEYKRDMLGRILEQNDGEAQVVFYDLGGRLLGRTLKGTGIPLSNYIYDKNGNRISSSENGTTFNATYDNQDRLLSFGSNTYSYGANGELASKVDSSLALTTYTYDSFGNLTIVNMPGKLVEYGLDGEGRRSQKVLNATPIENYIWQGPLKLVAIADASGVVSKKFIYSDSHSPDYMEWNGVSYLFLKDHRGSVTAVVNSSTGQVVQKIKYSEWGAVLSDTNPGLQPFGFAGGLYDNDTKLLKFGARSYDPEVGRWINKDPILFDGGDTNIYSYVLNDPINLIDPEGKSWKDVSVRNLLGGGLLFTVGTAAVITAPANPLGAIGAVVGAGAAISGVGMIKNEYDNFIKDDGYSDGESPNTPVFPPSANATKCP